MIAHRGLFCSLPDYVLKILDYRNPIHGTAQHSHHLFRVLALKNRRFYAILVGFGIMAHSNQHARGGILVGVAGMDADTTA